MKRCTAVDPSLHPSVRDRRCTLAAEHTGEHRREAVIPGAGMGVVLWTALALCLAACSGTQHPQSADGGVQERTILHSVAVGYCTVHEIGTPLILLAEAMWPAMTIPAHVADLFCAHVADQDRALRDPNFALSAGIMAHSAPPEYTLSANGFTVTNR